MAGRHGGAGLPPEDGGDRGGEDGLVAQVIPLRRRDQDTARAPERPSPSVLPTWGVFDPPEDPLPLRARTVWGGLISPLARKSSPAGSAVGPTTPTTDQVRVRLPSRWPPVAAAATTCATAAGALVLALGVLAGSPPHGSQSAATRTPSRSSIPPAESSPQRPRHDARSASGRRTRHGLSANAGHAPATVAAHVPGQAASSSPGVAAPAATSESATSTPAINTVDVATHQTGEEAPTPSSRGGSSSACAAATASQCASREFGFER